MTEPNEEAGTAVVEETIGEVEVAPAPEAELPTEAKGAGAPPERRSKTARKENPDQEKFYAALGARVQMAREAAGLTQSALGKLAHITPASICSIEANRQRPPIYTLVKIAQGLGFSDEETRLLIPRMFTVRHADIPPGGPITYVSFSDETSDLAEFLAVKFPPKPAPVNPLEKMAEENGKLAKAAGIPRVDLATVREEDGQVIAEATTAKGVEVPVMLGSAEQPEVLVGAPAPREPVVGVVQSDGPSPGTPEPENWMPDQPFVSKATAEAATLPAVTSEPEPRRAHGGEVCESCGNTAAEDGALFTIADSTVCEKCKNLLT